MRSVKNPQPRSQGVFPSVGAARPPSEKALGTRLNNVQCRKYMKEKDIKSYTHIQNSVVFLAWLAVNITN